MEKKFESQIVQQQLFEALKQQVSAEVLRKYRITVEGGRTVSTFSCELFTVKVNGRAIKTAAIRFSVAISVMLTVDYTAHSMVGSWTVDDDDNITLSGDFYEETKAGDTAANAALWRLTEAIAKWLNDTEYFS